VAFKLRLPYHMLYEYGSFCRRIKNFCFFITSRSYNVAFLKRYRFLHLIRVRRQYHYQQMPRRYRGSLGRLHQQAISAGSGDFTVRPTAHCKTLELSRLEAGKLAHWQMVHVVESSGCSCAVLVKVADEQRKC
jgi:hypothetical protein